MAQKSLFSFGFKGQNQAKAPTKDDADVDMPAASSSKKQTKPKAKVSQSMKAKPKPKPQPKKKAATKSKRKGGDDDEDEDVPSSDGEHDAQSDDDYQEPDGSGKEDSDEDALEADEDASDDNMAVEDDLEESEDEKPQRAKAAKGLKMQGKLKDKDIANLPPIHEITDIFRDIVRRSPALKNLAEHITGRKLRVATMCSGTESPLLALDLICTYVKELYDVEIGVEHVFSCEIEPFKQGYIERNFMPPLLFRDVCELGDAEAHTAFGALAPVPGDVDLLVAGTSCVDFSNLNNQKQTIDGAGESARTFRGMMSWITNHRPPLVILENVCSAPWDEVKKHFESKGYSAAFKRFDTKNYYIPHTRTRGYLVAVDQKHSNVPAQWSQMVMAMQRHASSPIDAFLLASDDPRIFQSRQKLVQESAQALEKKSGRTDWGRCESRHARARLEERLGNKRPLTYWESGGTCKLPEHAWNDWGSAQVERVWDLMDILTLRMASKDNVDPNYKTHVWNLSQNVDRTTGSNAIGICPCLTPNMIAFITNRGGPLVGLEALSLQGLPVDKLLLTRESEDQLADLAGNAMSSTVVGSCVIAALLAGKKLLKAGSESQSYEKKKDLVDGDAVPQETQKAVESLAARTEDRIVGEEDLVFHKLELFPTRQRPLPELLDLVHRSRRMCSCEGRTDQTKNTLLRCSNCLSTICNRCVRTGEHHDLQVVDLAAEARLYPADVARELKKALPMCVRVPDVTAEFLDDLAAKGGCDTSDKDYVKWRDAFLRACSSDIRFSEVKRQEVWTAVYTSVHATLELILEPKCVEWRLYAKADPEELSQSEIRRTLSKAVARLQCDGDDLTSGKWAIALPVQHDITVRIAAVGEPVPSWRNRLGLEDFKDEFASSQIRVSVADEDMVHLDSDISGTYDLFPKCGTANGALHKRQSDDPDARPLWFFLDPHPVFKDDHFVFSHSNRRHEYKETRALVCRVEDINWAPPTGEEEQEVQCRTPCQWVPIESFKLQVTTIQDAKFGTPARTLLDSMGDDACSYATALLSCVIPMQASSAMDWPQGDWRTVDKIHERTVFKATAWLFERSRSMSDMFNQWQSVACDHPGRCDRCAPKSPAIHWIPARGKKMVAIEDAAEAGEYERRLKRRPSPFVIQWKRDEAGLCQLRIGNNIPSLLHRAQANLPPTILDASPLKLFFRLNTAYIAAYTSSLAKFTMKSNKQDPEHKQPPHFKIPLRKEQRRSLSWMIAQEAPDAPPFPEEEIAEAVLEPLQWRAEARAVREVRVRGGVLADAVGYGKTAISLALIDCNQKKVETEHEDADDIYGKISIKATLIVVPPHLIKQWESEVEKFTKKHFDVLVLSSHASINTKTIEDYEDADIIIAASNLFKSDKYLDNLAAIAGCGSFPSSDGRYFDAHLERTLKAMNEKTEILKTEGPAALLAKMKEDRKRMRDEEAAAAAAAAMPSKRLKGKKLREATEKVTVTTSSAASSSAAPTPVPSSPASATSSSTRVEVVIERRPDLTGITGSDDEEEEAPKRSVGKRRSAKKVIISDDEDSDVKPAKRPAVKKGKKRALDSDDDFEMVSAGDESDEEVEDEEDEDAPAAKKRKGATKATVTRRASSTSGSSTAASSDMEVDDAPKKGKKRKAADDDKKPAKKVDRMASDPWKLGSTAVKNDWTKMKAPPLEMFHFARKIIDEYTYLDGKVLSLVTKHSASRIWVLSGTPPIHNFAALKTISNFLNIHLGVDDVGEGNAKTSAELKKRARDQTAAENFHSFREVHSNEWHAHRLEHGQAFLDQFVRQNVAEIDEIPWTTKVHWVKLPAAEYACYLELAHYLLGLDMQAKKTKKSDSDREKRLAQALGESQDATEALLKHCSHFDLQLKQINAITACDAIVQERERQRDDNIGELKKAIKERAKEEEKIWSAIPQAPESLFHSWVRTMLTSGTEDKEATGIIREMLTALNVKTRPKPPKDSNDKLPEKHKERIWAHREATHELRKLVTELIGRIRALRFFTLIRDFQQEREEAYTISCSHCGREDVTKDEAGVFSSCGHAGCLTCLHACAAEEKCVEENNGCRALARRINIVEAKVLGVDNVARDGKGRHYGRKLEEVVKLINGLPKNERVLLFVQFADLTKKVSEALDYHKIPHLEIKGSASARSTALDKFQNGSKERVLLLNVRDESASGANLTCANHAIFLSPLHAPTKELYQAWETQAVGRVVRYGQQKPVQIHRFITMDTIDSEIFEKQHADLAQQGKAIEDVTRAVDAMEVD